MRKFYFFFLLMIVCTYVNAEIFTVINNNDSGPGSLRDALTRANANGSTSMDEIRFNIPGNSEAARTITVLSDFPVLKPMLIIDASTQPSPGFGVTNARIKLFGGKVNLKSCFNLTDSHDIEIYGIAFNDFRYLDTDIGEVGAIYMPGKVQRIKVGAAGKGNVFFNCQYSFFTTRTDFPDGKELLSDITIQANLIGLAQDGETMNFVANSVVMLHSFRNVNFGGETKAEGNFVSCDSDFMFFLMTTPGIDNGTINIKNNYFGVDYSKTKSLRCGPVNIQRPYRFNNDKVDVVVNFINNTFNNVGQQMSYSAYAGVVIQDVAGFITIQGNEMNNHPGMISHGSQTTAFGIFNCKDGIIGGLLPEQQNFIAANLYCGISVRNSEHIKIQRNSIYCNPQGIFAVSDKVEIPVAEIWYDNGVDQLSGKATPGSTVELFETVRCTSCNNGEFFIGETVASADSSWSITATFSGAVTARATTPDGISGEFSTPEFEALNPDIGFPTCGKNNGYIHGVKFIRGTSFYWINTLTNDTIFNKENLDGIGRGQYVFVVEQTRYCTKKYSVTLNDNSPRVSSQGNFIEHPSCGKKNGNIFYTWVGGSYNLLFWINEKRDTVSFNRDLSAVGPGKYKLIVLDTLNDCGDSTTYFTLTNQSGPFFDSEPVITHATCGKANGRISDLRIYSGPGTLTFKWIDSSLKVVGTSPDLVNVPAGRYRLLFNDSSPCGTIESDWYRVLESSSPVVIKQFDLLVNPSDCFPASGSISGIEVENATSYQWYNSSGITVSQQLNPAGLSSGAYILLAKNAVCQSWSDSVRIQLDPVKTFSPPLVADSQQAICGNKSGHYRILNFPDANQYTFRWIDNSKPGAPVVSNTLNLENISKGNFTLIARRGGCEQIVRIINFDSVPPPQLDTRNILIKDDHCDAGTGAISGIKLVAGSGTAPYQFTWKNNADEVSGTAAELVSVHKGLYRLSVKDKLGCVIEAGPYEVKDMISKLGNPEYGSQTIAVNTATNLTPRNTAAGIYYLYNSATAPTPLQQNQTGIFNTGVLNSDKIFYIQLVNGSCTSDRVPVSIKVVNETRIFVPNAFTPNGDGKNDQLRPIIIGQMTEYEFKIFDRWGNVVFSGIDPATGWDGFFKGALSVSGNYLWFLKGKDIFGKTIAMKGNVVLIR